MSGGIQILVKLEILECNQFSNYDSNLEALDISLFTHQKALTMLASYSTVLLNATILQHPLLLEVDSLLDINNVSNILDAMQTNHFPLKLRDLMILTLSNFLEKK